MNTLQSPPRGLFISFEGIDGAGKSTHIATLAAAFEAAGHEVVCTREPGGTPLAEQLRSIVLNQPMDALTESLLVFAARREHVMRVIAPALQRHAVVLSDRFADATFAYQGGGRGFDWPTLQQLEAMVLMQPGGSLLQPDLTLWFDAPVALAAQRASAARTPDKFESQQAEFFDRVVAGYARRAAEDPLRFHRIDAALSLQAVWQQVERAVRDKGWLP